MLGTLGQQPLVLFLVRALDERFTGTLELIDARHRRHTLYLADGLPSQGHTPCRIAPLGLVLREMEVIDDESLRALEQRSGHNTVLLAHLLFGGGFLSERHLRKALGIQLARRLRSLLSLPPRTEFDLHADVNLVPGAAHGLLSPISPLPLLLPGIRARSADLPIADTLDQLRGCALSLRPSSHPEALGLGPREPLIAALRTPTSVDALRALPEADLEAKLYALVITRSLLVLRHSGAPEKRRTWPGAQASGVHRRVTPLRRIDPSVSCGTRRRP